MLFVEFEDDFVRCHFALRARKSFTTFYKKLLKRKKNTFKSFVTLFFCNLVTKYLDNMILHDSILFQDLIENVSWFNPWIILSTNIVPFFYNKIKISYPIFYFKAWLKVSWLNPWIIVSTKSMQYLNIQIKFCCLIVHCYFTRLNLKKMGPI